MISTIEYAEKERKNKNEKKKKTFIINQMTSMRAPCAKNCVTDIT